MDVTLSTQSNDVVEQVRTTGKLPLYRAADRYILATDVAESLVGVARVRFAYPVGAARVLQVLARVLRAR